jgi:hypothetical protein
MGLFLYPQTKLEGILKSPRLSVCTGQISIIFGSFCPKGIVIIMTSVCLSVRPQFLVNTTPPTFLDGFGRNLAQSKMMMGRCACERDFLVYQFLKSYGPWHLAYFTTFYSKWPLALSVLHQNSLWTQLLPPTFLNRLLCILAEGFSMHCTSIFTHQYTR